MKKNDNPFCCRGKGARRQTGERRAGKKKGSLLKARTGRIKA